MNELSRRSLLLGGVGALSSAALLGACSNGSSPIAGEDRVLRYSFLATRELPDLSVVQARLNELLGERDTGFSVELIALQNYDETIRLAIASGDAGDLYFTAPWSNSYSVNASQGNLTALDELLPEFAPNYWASMSEDTWNAARFDGRIYGGINQQIFPKIWGFAGHAEIADRYGLDVASIGGFAELEPYLARIREDNELIPWATSNEGQGGAFFPEMFGWDPIVASYGIAVRYDDDDLQAFCWYDTPEFREACELLRAWREAGLTEASSPSRADMTAKYRAGQIAFLSGQQMPTTPQNQAFEIVGRSFVDTPLLNTDGVLATLTGVSAESESPETAVRFMELLNTDPEIYHVIAYGIEGTHYDVLDAGSRLIGFAGETNETTSRYYPNTDWAFGNQFNGFYRNPGDAEDRRWEVEAEFNANATPSRAIGFLLDTSSLRTEVASVSAVTGELVAPALVGMRPAEQAVSELLASLERAGLNRILEETQSQLDEFRQG